jgi:hypothetical protein
MNFEEAIAVHQKWKVRLRVVIDGKSTETLDPEIVAKDDQCLLGQWIHGEGGKIFGSKPEFGEVKHTHADFHKVAAQVLRKSMTGDKAGAAHLLDGEFYQASSKVITAITKCKAACK